MLKVTVREAIFQRDVATFLDMDPHYTLIWKETKIEGEKAFGGGKTPKWNQTHQLDIGTDQSSMGVLTVNFMEGDNLICTCAMGVASLLKSRGTDQWHRCRHDGNDSGQFSMRIEYDGHVEDEHHEQPQQPVVDPNVQPHHGGFPAQP